MVEKIIERVTLRPQGSWTYEDWLTFPNDGWKYEIINGELHMTPAPATSHQRASVKLVIRLGTFVEDNDLGIILEAPCAVRLPNQPVPLQPDIFFIRKDNHHIIEETEVRGVPDLVIEILSPSNASYDRVEKFEVYQAAAVPEYWLVDYQAKTIEIFSLVEGVYQLAQKYVLSDTITSAQLPGFQLPVERVFDF